MLWVPGARYRPRPRLLDPSSRVLRGLTSSWAPSALWGCVGEGRVTQRSIMVNHGRVLGLIGDGKSAPCWNAADGERPT